MAELDLSQPLLGAGASAKTNFAAAQARAGIDLRAAGKFRRGLAADLGISAFANAAGEFSKFLAADVEGNAFAEARVGVQLQLPLDLFNQFGFAARAEAVAQAAAGVEAGLGLSIGDFILLAKRNPEVKGIALDLLIMFLEEVSIGGVFDINVAVTAKAHASLTVSGTVIERAPEKAGFYFTVDAGVGLAAGVGAGISAGAEFKNFRRFYGRAVDRTVDSTIDEIAGLLPAGITLSPTGVSFATMLEVFAPIAKTALRTAYELGLNIAQNDPGRSAADRAALCGEAVKIFLEETQRFVFRKLLENGIAQLTGIKNAGIATQIQNMPPEPFQDSAANRAYWNDLIAGVTNELEKTGGPDAAMIEAISVIYCAAELLMEAVRINVNTASIFVVAAGLGKAAAGAQMLAGSPAAQPPQVIHAFINEKIGGSGSNLTYAGLALFLASDLVIDRALARFPELEHYADVFSGEFGIPSPDLLRLFIQNTTSFDPADPTSINADPGAMLTSLVRATDSFIQDKFEREMLPVILENVGDENLKRYIRDVLYAAVISTKDIGLRSVLDWERKAFRNEDLTEALSGVMLMLLGRTLVVVADTLMAATQEQVQSNCKTIAVRLRSGDAAEANLFGVTMDPDLIALVADCVEIGGEVLGPLPDDTRDRVREILYRVFDPVPPGAGHSFLKSLADDFFIPSQGDLEQLTEELVSISATRLTLFVKKFILRMGGFAAHEIDEAVRGAARMLLEQQQNFTHKISETADDLKNFEGGIERRLGGLSAQVGKGFGKLTHRHHGDEPKKDEK